MFVVICSAGEGGRGKGDRNGPTRGPERSRTRVGRTWERERRSGPDLGEEAETRAGPGRGSGDQGRTRERKWRPEPDLGERKRRPGPDLGERKRRPEPDLSEFPGPLGCCIIPDRSGGCGGPPRPPPPATHPSSADASGAGTCTESPGAAPARRDATRPQLRRLPTPPADQWDSRAQPNSAQSRVAFLPGCW